MIEKINNIKNSKHPYSDEINNTIVLLEKIFNIILITINTIGFMTAILASTGLAEEIDESKYGSIEFPVNFFGYLIDIESDTFVGSPFVLFLHIIVILVLISLAILCIKKIITAFLKCKANIIDSLYHNEQLTELLIDNICNSKTE